MSVRRLAVGATVLVALVCASCSVGNDSVRSERVLASGTAAPAAAPDAIAGAGGAGEADAAPTEPVFEPTPVPPAEPTVAPTAQPATPTPTPTPGPDGPCNAGPLAAPDPSRPRYEATAAIDPVLGTVTGEWAVDFTPDLDVDEIVVRMWAAGPRPATGGTTMTLSETSIDGVAATVEVLEPTLATIALASPLAAGDTIHIEGKYELAVPGELNSRISRRSDYMRLGTFLPLLPWEPGRGWATDPATALFAEAASSPVADYAVAITVPPGFDVLASGVDDGTGVWRVEAARDFAASVGRFTTATATANAPEPVQVTVGVHETLGDDPDTYLQYVVDSLEQYSERWGQYPWPSLTVALTPDLGGGIEFPTHIMQGPGTIGRTTSHEVGHMYFYSLVGNNQGVAPWLDEGLTSYAEFTFEGTPPGAYSIPAEGVGQATQPMTFWAVRPDIYYRSVYGQTGFALQQLGPQEEVDCALARYVATNAFRIATAADLVTAFEPTFPDVVEQLAALGVNVE